MEASARLPGDTLPRAVPAALLAAGMLLEAAALEPWLPPDAPAEARATDAPAAPPTLTALTLPAEAPSVRVATRPRSCFPRFAVRFRAGESHFPATQVTRLTPLARWMSEHPGAAVTALASLDDASGDAARERGAAERRAAVVAWRLVALGVPRERLSWRAVEGPASTEVRFAAGGFDDCPADAAEGAR